MIQKRMDRLIRNLNDSGLYEEAACCRYVLECLAKGSVVRSDPYNSIATDPIMGDVAAVEECDHKFDPSGQDDGRCPICGKLLEEEE